MSSIFEKNKAHVISAINTALARRIYELSKGRKNKLLASKAITDLRDKKTKFRETKDMLQKLESTKSVMATELEVLRSGKNNVFN